MPANDLGRRQAGKIDSGDPEFSVRIAGFADLQRLQTEAERNGLSARWSSGEALVGQVRPDSKAIVCPVLINGGLVDQPESYRCHIWFVRRPDGESTVSLIDIASDSIRALPEVNDPALLRKVIRILLDGYHLSVLD